MMSFTPGMADSQGAFSDAGIADAKCRKCGHDGLKVEEWDSSCGGWTDYKYTCPACGHFHWVEGADA